jgi:hypothetical protein
MGGVIPCAPFHLNRSPSGWLHWNLGSTSPESSARFPLLTRPLLNLLLRRLTTHASPSGILNFSLGRLHQESNLCQISSPTSLSHSSHSSKHWPMGDLSPEWGSNCQFPLSVLSPTHNPP